MNVKSMVKYKKDSNTDGALSSLLFIQPKEYFIHAVSAVVAS